MRKILCILVLIFSCVSLVWADQLIGIDEALGKVFPKADSFESQMISLTVEQVAQIEQEVGITFLGNHSQDVQMVTAFLGSEVLGYAFLDTVMGKWGTIGYLVGLNTEGEVGQVVVLQYSEVRGRPIAKNRFLKQYKGKNISDPVQLKRDINGITGATISSRSITDGIRKILHIFHLLIP